MKRRKILVFVVSLSLVLGLVAMAGAVQPERPKVAPPTIEQRVGPPERLAAKQGKGEFVVESWDFEDGLQGWTAAACAAVGNMWHLDTFNSLDVQSWWMGDPALGPMGGYGDQWQQYLDSPQISLGATPNLSFYFWMYSETEEWDGFNVRVWDVTRHGPAPVSIDSYTDTVGCHEVRGWWVIHPVETYDEVSQRCWECHNEWAHAVCGVAADTMPPGFAREDAPGAANYSKVNFDLACYATHDVVVRLYFASDWASNVDDDTLRWGVFVDSIVIDGTDYTSSMIPRSEPPAPTYWTRRTPGHSPNYSLWAPDTINHEVLCLGTRGVDLDDCALSPWFVLPDSAKMAWIQYYWDGYCPGAAAGGYLNDYYRISIRSEGNMVWTDMFYDYDRTFDDTASNCDVPERWRFWHPDYGQFGYDYPDTGDTSGNFNGSMYITDYADAGDTVQLRIQWSTDTTLCGINIPGGCPCNADWREGRGMFFDDIGVFARSEFGHELEAKWEDEAGRPAPMSVPVGQTQYFRLHIQSNGVLATTSGATVSYDVWTPGCPAGVAADSQHSEGQLGAGFPAGADTIFDNFTIAPVGWTPTSASLACTILANLDLEVDLPEDGYKVNNTLPTYYINVTPPDTEMVGHDNRRSRSGESTPNRAAKVVHYHPSFFDVYHIYRMSIYAYNGAAATRPYEFTLLASYDSTFATPLFAVVGSTWTKPLTQEGPWNHLHLLGPGHVPLATPYVTHEGDTTYGYWLITPTAPIAGPVWIAFQKTDAGSYYPGMGSDDYPIPDGENSYTADSIWMQTAGASGEFELHSPQDWVMRMWTSKDVTSNVRFSRGDYNADDRIMMNDALTMLLYLFHQPGGAAPPCEDAADYNDDGSLMMNDALTCLLWLFSQPGGDPPAAPNYCNLDPTPDALTCSSYTPCGAKSMAKPVPIVSVKDAPNKDELSCGSFPPCGGTKGKAIATGTPVSVIGVSDKAVVKDAGGKDGEVRVPTEISSLTVGTSAAKHRNLTNVKHITPDQLGEKCVDEQYIPSEVMGLPGTTVRVPVYGQICGGPPGPCEGENLDAIAFRLELNTTYFRCVGIEYETPDDPGYPRLYDVIASPAGWYPDCSYYQDYAACGVVGSFTGTPDWPPDTYRMFDLLIEVADTTPVDHIYPLQMFPHNVSKQNYWTYMTCSAYPDLIDGSIYVSSSPQFIRGDLNADSAYTLGDGLWYLSWFLGDTLLDVPCLDAADINDDGNFTLGDGLHFINYFFENFPPIPPPSPDCGIDPTPDTLNCESFPPCESKAKVIASLILVSVKGASEKVIVRDAVVEDGEVVVPVDLVNVEDITGVDITLGYDASILEAVKVEGGVDYDYFVGYTEEAGKVRIGIVPDFEMRDAIGAGERVIAEVVFKVKGFLGNDVRISVDMADLYGRGVKQLRSEWIGGLVKAGVGLPTEFALKQNYPNPFNPTTLIKYDLPEDCRVRLEIFNILGEKVVNLVDKEEKAGYKMATWNAKDIASGVYFYKLIAGDFTSIKKMVLLK